LIDRIIELGYSNVELSGKSKIIVKVPDADRSISLSNLQEKLDAFHDTKTVYSSIGCLRKDGYCIVIKPIEKQGDGSAGKPNELFFVNKLNEYHPSKITFIASNKEIKISLNTFNHCARRRSPKTKFKTDIELIGDQIFNISLKQDNAQIWESADSYCSDLVHKYVNYLRSENKIILDCNENYCKIKPEIGVECNEKESYDVVFGDDIYGQGVVMTRTFTNNDFSYNNGHLHVNVSHLAEDLTDLTDYQRPYFLIRNDKTRNCGIQGLRVLAVYAKRINKHVLKIILNERL
jgi:hypothetical protein